MVGFLVRTIAYGVLWLLLFSIPLAEGNVLSYLQKNVLQSKLVTQTVTYVHDVSLGTLIKVLGKDNALVNSFQKSTDSSDIKE